MDEAAVRTLRAKYLDWCSARIAEQFVELSPEEIYSLVRPTVDPDDPESARDPEPPETSYRLLVQRATEALLARTPLPPFDEWRRAYETDPERYESELLGFWKDL